MRHLGYGISITGNRACPEDHGNNRKLREISPEIPEVGGSMMESMDYHASGSAEKCRFHLIPGSIMDCSEARVLDRRMSFLWKRFSILSPACHFVQSRLASPQNFL